MKNPRRAARVRYELRNGMVISENPVRESLAIAYEVSRVAAQRLRLAHSRTISEMLLVNDRTFVIKMINMARRMELDILSLESEFHLSEEAKRSRMKEQDFSKKAMDILKKL